jgi:divalent metal cation (Fe/Co/Zn/Cd) transporter
VLLVLVAIVLGYETSSLLVGEGATAEDTTKIRAALAGSTGVVSIIHMKTLYLGPDELMVGAKIAIESTDGAESIVKAIDEAEVAIRTAVPAARVIYLEPDILRVATKG